MDDFLSRLPGELGTYMGITGLQIRAADALPGRIAVLCGVDAAAGARFRQRMEEARREAANPRLSREEHDAMQLLGLDTSSPLPAWMLLNAVRHQRFSGEVTLHTMPAVRVWAVDGTVYWAERAGALAVADRLVELGVLDQRQAAAGTTQLGDAAFRAARVAAGGR